MWRDHTKICHNFFGFSPQSVRDPNDQSCGIFQSHLAPQILTVLDTPHDLLGNVLDMKTTLICTWKAIDD